MRTPLTDAQRALVEQNIDLAHHLALTVWRRNQSIDKDEIIAVAYEGLILAASRFDPSRATVLADGTSDLHGAFAGYARRRINGIIIDWQRSTDHVPRRQRSTYKSLQSHGYGAGRSASELADLTGMAEERIRLVVAAVRAVPVSLHASVNPQSHPGAYNDPLEPAGPTSPETVEAQALTTRIQESVTIAFDALSDFQRLVIAMRYYEGLELTVVATVLQTNLTTVRVAHSEALLSLHAAMISEAS